jgi:hypothetical protein
LKKPKLENLNMSGSTESEPDIIPRQPNGRLRFPDAFLHPEPSPPIVTEQKRQLPPEPNYAYRIRLLDDDNEEIGNSDRVVDIQDLE